MGKSIASKLLEMGYQVSSASRQVSKIKEDRSGVRHYSIDLTKEIKKTELLRDVETVFHVAAKAGVDGKYSDYYRANYIATKNILSACKISGVKNFNFATREYTIFITSTRYQWDLLPPMHTPLSLSLETSFLLLQED